MRKPLLWCLFTFLFGLVRAQAPSWQWAQEAASTHNESINDLVFDKSSGYIYAAGIFRGNLSAKYGSAFSSTYGNSDGFLAKYDASGNLIWAIKIGGNAQDEITGVAADPSGNIYVSGNFRSTADFDPSSSSYTLSSIGQRDGFLAKYSSTGSFIWAVSYGGEEEEMSAKIYADVNGVYITGSYHSQPATFNSYNNLTVKTGASNENHDNVFGAKYNSSGVIQWLITGGSDKDDIGLAVQADSNAVYFAGQYENDISFRDASGAAVFSLQAQQNNKAQTFIIAATQTGSLSWVNNITSSSPGKYVHTFALAQDNLNLFIAGYSNGNIDFKYPSSAFSQTNVSNGSDDLYLAKLSKTGTFAWNVTATGNATNDQFARCLAIDQSGNIVLGGQFKNSLNYGSAGGPTLTASAQDLFVSSYSSSGNFLWSAQAGGINDEIMNGIAVDNTGGIYVGGSHEGAAVFGAYTLSSGGGNDIFLAKTGCSAISNNTIASSQTVCSTAGTITLTGSAAPGANTYFWQSSPDSLTWSNASGTYTNQNYSAVTPTTSAYYRRNAMAGGSCSNIVYYSLPVKISIDLPPSSFAGTNQTICEASATLSAINPTPGTGTWSVIAGTASLSAPGSFSSQLIGLSTGTNSVMWTVANGACPSATSIVHIIRDAMPSAYAGLSQTICSSSAILSAAIPTVGSGSWSLISGNATLTAPASFSSLVSVDTGTSSFLWTVGNGSCPSATSSVHIVRDIMPVSFAGNDFTLCSSSTVLAASDPTAGTGTWQLLSGTGTVSAPNTFSSAVSGLSTGNNSFAWIVSNGSCPSASSIINITRDEMPVSNAGSDQTLCSSSATLGANQPTVGSGNWTLISGTATISSPNNFNTAVGALATGTNSFLWTVSNGVCPTATSIVNIVRDILPVANTGPDQTICNSSATLSAVQPTTGTGNWVVLAGNSSINSPTGYSTQVSSLNTGTNSFAWIVSNGTCPSATSVVNIIRDEMPLSNAGVDQTICSANATLTALQPSVGTGAWTIASGTANFSNQNNFSTAINALGTGTNSFIWTVSNGVCPSATSIVNIVRDIIPVANAGQDQKICSPSATLTAVQPSVGTGLWYVLSGGSMLSSPGSFSTQVMSLNTGTNSFAWKVSNGSCPSATSIVNIIRDELPQANAGNSQTLCAQQTTLDATQPAIGSGTWTCLSGSSIISSPNNYSTIVSSLTEGLNSFAWTVSNGSCPPATSTVVIQRDKLPVAYAGNNQTICESSATLSALQSTTGMGVWSLLSGSATIKNPANFYSEVSDLSEGSNTFVWTVSNGSCPSASAAVTIQRDLPPEIANAGPDQHICGPETELQANLAGSGNGQWKVLNNSGVISDPLSPKTRISNLNPGSTQLVWIRSSGVCPDSKDTLSVLSDAPPSSANAGEDIVTCLSELTVSPVSPQTGEGSWSVSEGSVLVAENKIPTRISGIKTGTNVLVWTVKNGICPLSHDTLILVRNEIEVSPYAGEDQTLEISVSQLNAREDEHVKGQWTVVLGDARLGDSHSPTTEISNLSFGNNILRWTVSVPSCKESSDDVVLYVKPFSIPNAFSPNGDGINDRFIINSLDYYGEAKLSVFNRWGDMLYINSNYKNDWDGTNSNGEMLADDTYYYILEVPGLKTFTGFVILKQTR